MNNAQQLFRHKPEFVLSCLNKAKQNFFKIAKEPVEVVHLFDSVVQILGSEVACMRIALYYHEMISENTLEWGKHHHHNSWFVNFEYTWRGELTEDNKHLATLGFIAYRNNKF